MKHIIDASEVLGTVELLEGTCEVCAGAQASFSEDTGKLSVRLEAFLRPAGLLVKERHFRADWLPENEMVEESVALDETHEVSREIFHRWVRKVRGAAPELHHV